MTGNSLRWGSAGLLALVAGALCAPWLSATHPRVQLDPVNGANLAPGSRRYEIVQTDGSRRLAREVEIRNGRLVALVGAERFSIPLELVRPNGDDELVRELFLPFGTDRVGRDVWSRLLHAGRISLVVALAAALLASALGVAFGSVAAIGGRAADMAVMRVTDAFAAFPRLFLLLALTAFFDAGPWTVVLVLGVTSWMTVARLVRAELQRLGTGEMALAARALGSSAIGVLFKHLLPNALTPIVVATTLRIGDVLLLEAALSFLGLGIAPPTPSWGNMIADGAADLATAWWTSTLPGLAIVATVVTFNLLGDGLEQRARRRGGPGT